MQAESSSPIIEMPVQNERGRNLPTDENYDHDSNLQQRYGRDSFGVTQQQNTSGSSPLQLWKAETFGKGSEEDNSDSKQQ